MDDNSYKQTEIREFSRISAKEKTWNRFWGTFRECVSSSFTVPVAGVSLLPRQDDNAVVAVGGTRLELHRPSAPSKNVNLKDEIHSVCTREDGKLVAVSLDDGSIHVMSTAPLSSLRVLRGGHTRPVHGVSFLTRTSVVSGGDDAIVREWDIGTGEATGEYRGHVEYVRSVDSSEEDHVFATGGYDHKCMLWDSRTKESSLVFEHQQPVEDVLFLPGGMMMAVAAGPLVRVWDARNNSTPLASIQTHTKTITSLAVLKSHVSSVLLSGGLDGLIKVHDLGDFSVLHTATSSSPVLSLDADTTRIAAACVDGKFWVRQRRVRRDKEVISGSNQVIAASTTVVENEIVRAKKLAPFDRFLRKFEYHRALDAAITTGNAAVVCSVLEELKLRDGLATSLQGRDDQSLAPLLRFMVRHICDHTYGYILLPVVDEVLGIYASVLGQSQEIDNLFFSMRTKLQEEISLHKSLYPLCGQLDLAVSKNLQ